MKLLHVLRLVRLRACTAIHWWVLVRGRSNNSSVHQCVQTAIGGPHNLLLNGTEIKAAGA